MNAADDFRLEGEPTIGAIGEHDTTLEFFFTFETDIAHGRGHARLVEDPNSPGGIKAFTILTAMKELKKFPQATARNRSREDLRMTSRELDNWLDRRNKARQFTDHDPEVVIIGGGQSGLMLAARLGQLNVSTLVVEKTDRVGDVWRNRYHSLQLHNEICMNHFAYMPFPDTWPVYIPKDKFADWLEFYAETHGTERLDQDHVFERANTTTRPSDGPCGCALLMAARERCGRATSSWRSA